MSIMKKVAPMLLAVSLLLAGCGAKTEPSDTDSGAVADPGAPVSESETEQPEESKDENSGIDSVEDSDPSEETNDMGTRVENLEKQLKDLELDSYPELTIDAAILERKAILAGTSFEVHVTIKNEGDKTVIFPHGSGTAEIPDAVYVYSDGLQTVIPAGNLGPMTMDMRYNELAPGETAEFVYTLMAVEPNKDFDEFTWDAFSGENSTYIADLTPEELAERFPELTFVTPDTYDIHAVFLYSVAGEEDPVGNPTSYAEKTIQVSIAD